METNIYDVACVGVAMLGMYIILIKGMKNDD